MCTILTISRDVYLVDRPAFISRILSDVASNPDGLSLIAVDPTHPMSNISLNCMAVGHVLNMIDVFFAGGSEYARIWLHTRAATTDYIGIPFNHGFTDSRGTMIHHNGIIGNYRNLHVDSFNLVDYRTEHAGVFMEDLITAQENFANVFLIRPDLATYGVVRMWGGTLVTDGMGNYSSRPVADIQDPVPPSYAKEYRLVPSRQSSPAPVSDSLFAWDLTLDKAYLKAE